jgi:replication factor C subunit 3/5
MAVPGMESMPWIEKYRPSKLDDLVAHEEIVGVLNRLISSDRLPHLLFYGPPGTGKTSTILACAKMMYGAKFHSMTLEVRTLSTGWFGASSFASPYIRASVSDEPSLLCGINQLNASDDRGIDVVRNQVKEFAGSKRLFSSGVKLVILDEADAMTSDAQFALRRVIEKYTRSTRFCLICNYVNKIIPALQSRCTKFRFAPLRPEQIEGRLNMVVGLEGVKITDGGKAAIMKLSCGDMRRVLNLLQSTHMAHREVTETTAYLTAGAPLEADLDVAQELLFSSAFKDAYAGLKRMAVEKGYALQDLVTEITARVIAVGLPSEILILLLDKLSTIEYRLSYGGSEVLQLGDFVGAFVQARDMLVIPAGTVEKRQP